MQIANMGCVECKQSHRQCVIARDNTKDTPYTNFKGWLILYKYNSVVVQCDHKFLSRQLT